MHSQGILAVVNASAGTAYRRSVDAVASFLASASARRGTSFELARTQDLDELDSALGSLDGRQLVLRGQGHHLALAVSRLARARRPQDQPQG